MSGAWLVTQKAKAARFLGAVSMVKRPLRRPIFVFATRRGGSTLLMQMIYSQPGLDYIDQPLDFHRYHPHRDRLPKPYLNRFLSLDEKDSQQLRAYFQSLLAGKFRIRHQWNWLDLHYSFLVNRLVVKELATKWMIGWFAEEFDIDVVYLLRHPIPTALSIIQRGWPCMANAFLRDEAFCEEYLSAELLDLARAILQHGSALEQYVLEWCLDNVDPLRRSPSQPWLCVTHEEIVLRPVQMSEMICLRLDLPAPNRMATAIDNPTRTTSNNSRSLIKSKGPKYLVNRWVETLSTGDKQRVQAILDAFEIQCYSADGALPNPKNCHFGRL